MKRLKVTSIIMLIAALPFAFFSALFFVASLHETGPQPVGCLISIALHLFSILTAILGLVACRKPGKKAYRVCGWIQLLLVWLNMFFLREFSLFLAPVLLILTIIFLTGKGRKTEG